MTEYNTIKGMTNEELALALVKYHEAGTQAGERRKVRVIKELKKRGVLTTSGELKNNRDIKKEIKELRLNYSDIAPYLINQMTGEQGISVEAFRKRLQKPLTKEEHAEIIEAIEKAVGKDFGIV